MKPNVFKLYEKRDSRKECILKTFRTKLRDKNAQRIKTHVLTKRTMMREDIRKHTFLNVYEQEAWKRINELILGNDQIPTSAVEVLRSVDKKM